MDEGLEFPDGIGILTVKDDLAAVTHAAGAEVQGAQVSRGQVDPATLPSTGGGDAAGAIGTLLLALALLVRRGRGRAAVV
jgi:hypothetical protein